MANYIADILRIHSTTVAATLALLSDQQWGYSETSDVIVVKDSSSAGHIMSSNRLFYDEDDAGSVVFRAQSVGTARVEFDASNYMSFEVSSSGKAYIHTTGTSFNISKDVMLDTDVKIYTTDWQAWSPTITVSGGTVPTFSTTQAYYIKIGKLVHWTLFLSGDAGAEGAGSNPLEITLPVNAINLPSNYVIGSGNYQNNTTFDALIATSHITKMQLIKTASNAAMVGTDQDHALRSIRVGGTYLAA